MKPYHSMTKKANVIMTLLFIGLLSVNAQTDTIKTQQIREITVSGQYIQQSADHYNCIPTAAQRKHSHSGYELLRSMMIPGVNMDAESGKVTTPAGAATLYINGREATFREIQSLRPKDVVRVEYYDMPTGKYAKDQAVINYVVKQYKSGGYTQLDALQGVGYKRGDYNITSKYSFGNYNVNLWAGYSNANAKEGEASRESYGLLNTVSKTSVSNNNDKENIGKYITASLSNMTQERAWMLRASIEANQQWDNILNGRTEYISPQGDALLDRVQYSRNSTVKPTIYAYYQRQISKNQSLDAVLDAYYANTQYKRDLSEDGRFISNVDEDYFYGKFNVNYSIALPKKNNLTFSLHEYMRVSQDDYGGDADYWQHLHSSETIFFVDYNKRWKKVMFNFNPGLSYLVYQLHGDDAVKHLAPRLQLSSSWMPDELQRFRLFFSLGNTFPSLSSVNHVSQQIDRVMIRRGNPDMDNSTLLGPGLTYSLNYKQISAMLSCYYMYMSNAIVNTYSVEGNNIINSFSSDARSHQTSTSLSVTWKPSASFNIKLDGNFTYAKVTKAIDEQQRGWQMGMQANYYVGDFSLSASCKSLLRSLNNYQYHIQQPWQYGLSAEWSHDNLAVVLEAKNLFTQDNVIKRSLSSNVYDLSEQIRREQDNAYASLKLICSLDYGKKVRRSPQYEMKNAESTILR